MSFAIEFLRFLSVRKKYWLLPILLLMMLALWRRFWCSRKEVHSLHLSTRSSNNCPRMRILGISAFYHDSAAALVDGRRYHRCGARRTIYTKETRLRLPPKPVEFCLMQEAVCLIDEVDFVVFYEKPFLKFERLIETYLAFAPRGLRSF